ncbi:MAG TPA: hypothetical protein VJZ32_08815 [Candidatus Bathyarchaeia archaeon]|nr:hypothetical protein [Candidatus Bathyarchaeia archaeon]
MLISTPSAYPRFVNASIELDVVTFPVIYPAAASTRRIGLMPLDEMLTSNCGNNSEGLNKLGGVHRAHEKFGSNGGLQSFCQIPVRSISLKKTAVFPKIVLT